MRLLTVGRTCFLGWHLLETGWFDVVVATSARAARMRPSVCSRSWSNLRKADPADHQGAGQRKHQHQGVQAEASNA
jgi:hypothetical protein